MTSIHEKVILYKQYLKEKIGLLVSLRQIFQKHFEMLQQENIDEVLLLVEQENDIMKKIDVLDEKKRVFYQEAFSNTEEILNLEIEIQSIGKELAALHDDVIKLSEDCLRNFDNQIKMVQKEKSEILQRQNAQNKYLNPYSDASQVSYFMDFKK